MAEVAGRLKVCNATIYKLVDVGFLPHTRVGNSIRIAEAALARLADVSLENVRGGVGATAEAAPAPERVPVSFGASALEALEGFV